MPRVPVLAAFALLAALAGGAAAAAAPHAPLAPRALADSVAAHYARMAAYRFSGQSVSVVTGDSMPMPMRNEVPFLFAAVRPGRLRNEVDHPVMGARITADGESLTVYMPARHQYTVQPAPQLVPGTASSDAFTNQLQPLLSLAQLTGDLTGVEDYGRDTVRTVAGPVSCRKLLLHYRADSTQAGSVPQSHVLWIDEPRRLVLRDSTRFRIEHTVYGAVQNEMVMRFASADDLSGGPDTLYTAPVPPGATRIVPATLRAPEPPALAGRDAPDFTLPSLEGRKVTLSALRGSVVVLDFWATWCGPCRRWMPIVGKVEKDLAGKGAKFYAVNLGDAPEKVRKFVKDTGVTVSVLLDRDSAVGERYEARSIPLTVVVGRDGKVARALLGLHTEAELREAIAAAGVGAAK